MQVPDSASTHDRTFIFPELHPHLARPHPFGILHHTTFQAVITKLRKLTDKMKYLHTSSIKNKKWCFFIFYIMKQSPGGESRAIDTDLWEDVSLLLACWYTHRREHFSLGESGSFLRRCLSWVMTRNSADWGGRGRPSGQKHQHEPRLIICLWSNKKLRAINKQEWGWGVSECRNRLERVAGARLLRASHILDDSN